MLALILVIAGFLLYGCYKIVCLQRHRDLYVCELNRSYETALSFLKEDPKNLKIRARCERLGREFYGEILPGVYGKQGEKLYLGKERLEDYQILRDELLERDLTAASNSSLSPMPVFPIRKAS